MKKLSDNSTVTPDKQFRNEVGNLRGIQHENIVRLYGCCYEVQRKVIEQNGTHIRVEVSESFLCYEYAANGNLDKCIFGMGMKHSTQLFCNQL